MTGIPLAPSDAAGYTIRAHTSSSKERESAFEVAQSVSVVIPTVRNLDAVLALTTRLVERSSDALLEIIVVLDRELRLNERPQATEFSPKVHLVVMGCNSGAAMARNAGIERARGDIVLFTDDDCLPCDHWVERHLSCYAAADVVAVGAPVQFVNSRPTKNGHLLDGCSLLFAFRAPETQDELLWNPTANLSVRRSVAASCLMSDAFPKAGGGEDVHFGFLIATHGRIASEPTAPVAHPYWEGLWCTATRFFRWGRADAILAKQCHDTPELAERLVEREWTPVTWFSLSSFVAIVLFVLSKHWPYLLLPLGGMATWIVCEILLWHRGEGIRKTLVEIASVLCFDLGSTLSRCIPRNYCITNRRILFFRDQLPWLWLASRRVMFGTLLGYCMVLAGSQLL